MNRPDTDAQDQLLQIITFGLQRAAGPYRWAISGRQPLPLLLLAFNATDASVVSRRNVNVSSR